MTWNFIHKYLANECSRKERLQFERWLEEDSKNRDFFQSVKKVWDVSPQQALNAVQLETLIKDDDAAWKQFKTNHQGIFQDDYLTDKPNIAVSDKYQNLWQRRKKFQYRLVYAAAAIALLIAAIFIFQSNSLHLPVKKVSHTYISEAGEHIKLQLSDGTHITLNENSKLTVYNNFTKQRRVLLKGEAFFEVSHDADHPFTIKANSAVVKDLGTKFDVKTDSVSNKVRVAVIEGKVSLKGSGVNNKTGIILTKNELGIYNVRTGSFLKEHTRAKNFLSWYTRKLIFRNNSLLEVSKQLEYLYDVKIVFAKDKLKRRRLSANLDKNDLKSVLNVISKTLKINYSINNNIIIWKNN